MGFDHHNSCNIGLSLGLGNSLSTPKTNLNLFDDQQTKSSDHSLPCLTLGLSSTVDVTMDTNAKVAEVESSMIDLLHRQSSSISAVSTFSNSSVKREREASGSSDQEIEVEEKVSSPKVSMDDHELDIDQEDTGGARKKLRLTKEQSLVLEESFKEHSTLNPKQKQGLAKRLNLSPRQVEVWFQNRRARTKLKQNELDCELLKKCCETLTDENTRLKKEIQELKAMKAPFYMQFPAATLTMCPRCESITASTGACHDHKNSTSFPVNATKPRFFGALTHPSVAPC